MINKNSIVRRDCVLEGNNYVAGNIYASNVGYGTYIHRGSVLNTVKVGRFCSIGEYVDISLFDHPISQVSTSPLFYRCDNRSGLESFVAENTYDDIHPKEDGFAVTIGNDVWIGNHVSIKGGISIGDGAVIATGAVVTHDVEPYSIVGGIPAYHIRYRFSTDQINKLLEIRWWDKEIDWLRENGCFFRDIDRFIDMNFEKE